MYHYTFLGFFLLSAFILIGVSSQEGKGTTDESNDDRREARRMSQSINRHRGAVAKKPKCKPGESKKQDCNQCRCTQTGIWICTLRGCLPKRDTQLCSPGDSKQEDCNTCKCLKSGLWACTRRGCLHKRQVRGVSADLRNTPCAPNDYFMIDCNTCYCNIEKTGYICTENLCPFIVNSSTSPDNSTSSAATTETAIIASTLPPLALATPSNISLLTNSSDTHDTGGDTRKDSFSCIPGQAFKKDCNTCTCTPDGKNALCTQKFCGRPALNQTENE